MAQLKAIAVLLVFCSQTLLFPILVTAHPPAQQQLGSKLVLEDGTPVKLRLARTISSADETVGNQIDLEVVEEIQIGNKIVIPKGSVALATVTDVQAKRRMGRGGKLDVNIDSVRLANGQKAALRAVKNSKGGGHTGAMTVGIVATSLVLWPAAPLFLLMHGKDIAIPKGTPITAYVEGSMNLDARTFRNTEGPEQAVAVSVAEETAGSASTVTVSSLPAGAEISVDGNFVGNTPSALNLPSGEHVISVSRAGYQSRQRRIKLSGGNVNLTAELLKGAEVQEAPTSAQPVAATVYPQEQGTAIKVHSRVNVQQVTLASPGWIGVTTKRGTGGLEVVTALAAQGPAATAGLKIGDTITKINGNTVTDDDFQSQISAFKFGSNVAITYMRGSWASIVIVTVGVETL
jgi:hypothetical protein